MRKRSGVAPSVAAVVDECPQATENSGAREPFTPKYTYGVARSDCYGAGSAMPGAVCTDPTDPLRNGPDLARVVSEGPPPHLHISAGFPRPHLARIHHPAIAIVIVIAPHRDTRVFHRDTHEIRNEIRNEIRCHVSPTLPLQNN